MTTTALKESLSGNHARMSAALPGIISAAEFPNMSYIYINGATLAELWGEDHAERGRAIARAIAAHDKLVTMATFLQPSFGTDGIRVTISEESFRRMESMLAPGGEGRPSSPTPSPASVITGDEWRDAVKAAGPGEIAAMPADAVFVEIAPCDIDDLAFTIGAAVRRRNRSQPRAEQPMAPCMEYGATDVVLKALAECGYKVVPPEAPGTPVLAEVIEESEKVRTELRLTGHQHEGRPLHQLVDAAIDRERVRAEAFKERVAAIHKGIQALTGPVPVATDNDIGLALTWVARALALAVADH